MALRHFSEFESKNPSTFSSSHSSCWHLLVRTAISAFPSGGQHAALAFGESMRANLQGKALDLCLVSPDDEHFLHPPHLMIRCR